MNFQKIEKRVLNMFDKCELDDELLSTQLSKESLKRLLDYQIIHTLNLITCLKKINIVLDGSSTGTGKTYTTICVCKELNLRPLIICPKSIISVWKDVCDYFGVIPLDVINYESIRNGNLKYLQVTDDGDFNWTLDKNIIIILDEAHKCKSPTTLNGKMMLSLKPLKRKVMLISATIADKPSNFKIFGYMLDFYNNLKKGNNWIEGIIQEDENRLNKKSNALYDRLYPFKGSRMSLQDIGDRFPKNQISADCYTLDDASQKELDNYYDVIKSLYKESNLLKITKILLYRQKIELLKIKIITEQLEKYLENNKSVVIFVNFIETLQKLKQYLKDNKINYSEVHGNQSLEERDENIKKFQTDTVNVIICMIQAGGQSISLHDLNGNHPRVSLIIPSFSSIDLIQAFGRIYRVGVKTAVLQRIILCNNKYERLIAAKIKEKFKFNNFLGELNDKTDINNSLNDLLF
jgi:hypothetical protein